MLHKCLWGIWEEAELDISYGFKFKNVFVCDAVMSFKIFFLYVTYWYECDSRYKYIYVLNNGFVLYCRKFQKNSICKITFSRKTGINVWNSAELILKTVRFRNFFQLVIKLVSLFLPVFIFLRLFFGGFWGGEPGVSAIFCTYFFFPR